MKICIKKNGIIYLGELLKKYPLKPAAVEKLKMDVFVKRKVYQFSIEKYTIILKKLMAF